jgi:hypothetical protein
MLVELALIKLCYLKNTVETAKLLENVEQLKSIGFEEKKNLTQTPDTALTALTKQNTKIDFKSLKNATHNPNAQQIKEAFAKNFTQQENKTTTIDLPQIPQNATIEELWECFKQFMYLKYNSENLKAALDSSRIEYQETVLTLFYIHSLQKWLIEDEEKYRIFEAYFKKSLNNPDLVFRTEKIEIQAEDLLTSHQQKVQNLIQANPDFMLFINTFDFQIE